MHLIAGGGWKGAVEGGEGTGGGGSPAEMHTTAALLLATAAVFSGSSQHTLRQLHLVFRHGQRSPADTYPKDPYINHTFPPHGWGQLTNEGRMQQYHQGQWLKERYGEGLLKDGFSTSTVEAWTTDVDRTKMSMQLMMAGLFPPQGEQIWNPELLWQPVPSTHQVLGKDSLLLVRGCPRYSETLQKVMEFPEVKSKVANYNDLYKFLTEHTGMNITNPEDVQDVYSTLKAEEDFKLELPEWTKEVYPDRMREATALSFVLNVYNKELQKIKGGPLLKKILKDSQAAAEGAKTKKLFAYAGHDSTVANLLMALQVWDVQVPVYNIMAMVEVHQKDNQFGLQFYLRNTTTHEPFELTLPGCESLCPLDKVKELTQEMMPDNPEQECTAQDTTYVAPKDGGP